MVFVKNKFYVLKFEKKTKKTKNPFDSKHLLHVKKQGQNTFKKINISDVRLAMILAFLFVILDLKKPISDYIWLLYSMYE